MVQLSVLTVASAFIHTDLPDVLGALGEELVKCIQALQLRTIASLRRTTTL